VKEVSTFVFWEKTFKKENISVKVAIKYFMVVNVL
jgi:hypothetical protein